MVGPRLVNLPSGLDVTDYSQLACDLASIPVSSDARAERQRGEKSQPAHAGSGVPKE